MPIFIFAIKIPTIQYVAKYSITSNIDLLKKKGWEASPPPINQVNKEINKLHVAIRDREAVNEQEFQRLRTLTEKSR